MKILHVDMSGPFTEHMTYQENLLPEAMFRDGHEVVMCAPNFEWKEGKIVKTFTGKKIMDNGVELRRYGFKSILRSGFVTRKIRFVPGFYQELKRIAPDIIMLHCPQTQTSLEICRYVKDYPDVKLVVDSHTDYNNSAKNFFSRFFLHRIIYKYYVKQVDKVALKTYYITSSVKEFYMKEYGIRAEHLSFLPLGGFLPDDSTYERNRKKKRSELGLSDQDVLFLHSGKIDRAKKTDLLVKAFKKVGSNKAVLIILGSMDEEMKYIVDPIIDSSDGKIRFLGWKSGDELTEYLCAADVYVQPGGQSATFQNSICNRCAVISYPHKSYLNGYVDGNGLWARNGLELVSALRQLSENIEIVNKMKIRSTEIAQKELDYMVQGRKIIKECI